jgi:hypothetical protein
MKGEKMTNKTEYLEMLEIMTGITQTDMETVIRPIYNTQGHDAAKRELKRISGQPLVETDVIVRTYFDNF